MSAWIDVVGIGEDGLDGLGATARAAFDRAEVIFGGARHLAMLPPDGRERVAWPSPFDALIERIAALEGRPVCVLASGDPLCYGVGTRLLLHFPREALRIHPAPSSFSLACARLGWSLPDIDTVTLHGRPLASLHPWVQPGARVIALCRDGATPAAAAALLVARGYGPSRVVVLERLGGAAERIREWRADETLATDIDDLCTIAIECVADDGAPLLARCPGLPDDAFRHDGQITKRVVRAATVAALAPAPGHLLWDVGAGCGSVAIEWLRAAPRAAAIAIERDPARRELIDANAEALGTPDLKVVAGEAPAALDGLAAPDAVFVGGGLSDGALLRICRDRLRPGGRLVANAVTIEGERSLTDLQREHGGDLVRIAVEHLEAVGRYRTMRPALPVTQWIYIKDGARYQRDEGRYRHNPRISQQVD